MVYICIPPLIDFGLHLSLFARTQQRELMKDMEMTKAILLLDYHVTENLFRNHGILRQEDATNIGVARIFDWGGGGG